MRKDILIFIVIITLLSGGCTTKKPYQKTVLSMDTVIDFTVYGDNAQEAVTAAITELQRLDDLLSSHSETSEIAAINKAAGNTFVKVSPDTLAVLQQAMYFAKQTDGAFDPTIGSITQLWAIGSKDNFVPDEVVVAQALRLVDYRQLSINEQTGEVMLLKPNMRLDLGGIAKGYVLRRLKEILISHNIKSALINGGGDVLTIGNKPDGTPWVIGVQHPRIAEKIVATIRLNNYDKVETSGDYQRGFVLNGTRYHHIFDPKTGYPTRTIASATIVSNGVTVPSSILLVLGAEHALAFMQHNYPDAQVLLVADDGKLSYSQDFAKIFDL